MFPKHVNEQMPQFSANSQKIQKNQLGKESAQIIKTKINQWIMRYYILFLGSLTYILLIIKHPSSFLCILHFLKLSML